MQKMIEVFAVRIVRDCYVVFAGNRQKIQHLKWDGAGDGPTLGTPVWAHLSNDRLLGYRIDEAYTKPDRVLRFDWDVTAKLIDQYPEAIVLLDVRSSEEFHSGHVPDATLIPLDQLVVMAERRLPDKGKVYLVYCRSGRRSEAGAAILRRLGYPLAFNSGGVIDYPDPLV